MELCQGLIKKGYKIIYFSPKQHFDNSVYYIHTPINYNSKIPVTYQLKKQVLKNLYKIDFENDKALILTFGETTGYAAMTLKNKLSIPLILALRTNSLEDRYLAKTNNINGYFPLKHFKILKNRMYLFFFKKYILKLYNCATTITTQNQDDSDYIQKLSNAYNVVKIPNNLNVSWIEKQGFKNANESESLNKLCFVGSSISRKGLKYLLDAYMELFNSSDGLVKELHLIGVSETDKNVPTNFSDFNIVCHGFVENPLGLIAQMDLLVVPSLIESFPNIVFEAWHVGTPVIGSNVGGIKEQLFYKELLFKPKNKEELKQKLVFLMNNDNYLYAKALNDIRKQRFIFDWVKLYSQLIDSVLSDNLNEKTG